MKYTDSHGFTLIETLVATTIMTVSIVAPMLLAAQALSGAYYARDQVTASNLAQEAIEAVRAVRDGQVLLIARDASASGIDLFGSIPFNQDFIVDSTKDAAAMMNTCSGVCPAIKTDGTLYGYTTGWKTTPFTRTVRMSYVPGTTDEVKLLVTVRWRTQGFPVRTFTISENMYRWINDGAGT